MGKTFNFISGALFGAAAGAIIGVALAPRSAPRPAPWLPISPTTRDNMRDTYEHGARGGPRRGQRFLARWSTPRPMTCVPRSILLASAWTSYASSSTTPSRAAT